MIIAEQLELIKRKDHLPKPKARIMHKKESPKNPQKEKRRVQQDLNSRLATYIFENPSIVRGIISLAGTKIAQATYPFLNLGIANKILIAEHNRSAHAAMLDIMRVFPEDFKQIMLSSKPLDVFKVASEAIKTYPEEWTGFDLDFDGTLNTKKKGQLVELIETIDASAWWLRLGITVRPYSAKQTREILDEVWKYISSRGSIQIEDLATGQVFEYHDSALMQTMQVICTRR